MAVCDTVSLAGCVNGGALSVNVTRKVCVVAQHAIGRDDLDHGRCPTKPLSVDRQRVAGHLGTDSRSGRRGACGSSS